MPETLSYKIIVTAAVAGIASIAHAAAETPSAYRLRAETSNAFRLGSPAAVSHAHRAAVLARVDNPVADYIDRDTSIASAPDNALMLIGSRPTAVVHAADKGSEMSSAYRLRAENPGAFRLGSSAVDPPAQPAVAAGLADKPFAELIDRAAREASLDPALVHALIHVESRHNPAARSPKGALGLMQVLPETAARYGVADTTRSVTMNLSVGTRYLRDLMVLFDGHLELVLAAYNAGENAVLRYGRRIPPYRETEHYVPAVLAKYRQWQEISPAVAKHRHLQEPSPAAPPGRRRIEYLPGTTFDSTDLPGPRP